MPTLTDICNAVTDNDKWPLPDGILLQQRYKDDTVHLYDCLYAGVPGVYLFDVTFAIDVISNRISEALEGTDYWISRSDDGQSWDVQELFDIPRPGHPDDPRGFDMRVLSTHPTRFDALCKAYHAVCAAKEKHP